MALTGLDIFKVLPKTNCKECGQPTCLAFAMALAAGKTALDKCPHVSDDAKEVIGGAAAPPIATIKVGKDGAAREIGGETILFRHDKTFINGTGFAIEVSDTLEGDALTQKIDKVNDLVFERVGQTVSIDYFAIKNDSGDAAKFANAAKVAKDRGCFAILLISEDAAAIEKALAEVGDTKPIICGATEANWEKMVELAKKYEVALVVKGTDLDTTAALVEKVAAQYKQLIIDIGSKGVSQAMGEITQTRRLAIKKRFRPLGYPVITFTTEKDPRDEVVEASVFVCKYSSIVVMKADEKAQILPLMALRTNIYTDPQKPSQTEAKAFAIGAVTKNSPVYLTTNFSLTYYTVEGEVSSSKIPSYILAAPTDGTSVLTAWAAGKFSGEKLAEFIKECGIEDLVDHREIIIPGHVAVIKGGLEEKSGWKVIIGPAEAAGIPSFAKARFA